MSDKKGLPPVVSDRETYDLNHRLAQFNNHGDDEEKQRLSDDLRTADSSEQAKLLPKEEQHGQSPPPSSFTSGLVWMVINTLATIGIVNTTYPFSHQTVSATS